MQPWGEFGDRVAATLGIQVGLVQMRPEQGEQRVIGFGEVAARPAEQEQQSSRCSRNPSCSV